MNKKCLHRYIAVDGPIGSGKTVVSNMLAKELDAQLVLEPVAKNPFLTEFYKNREKNAFKTQLFFLLNRYQQQLELKQQNLFKGCTVCDYTFAKDLIFANINLSEDEQNLYSTVYNLLDSRLPKPDLVVYLQVSPEVLLKRIKARGISYEKSVDIDYLESLTEAYNDYFFQYSDTPLLIVNSNDMDVDDKGGKIEDWKNLKSAIFSHKRGIAHHHYVGK